MSCVFEIKNRWQKKRHTESLLFICMQRKTPFRPGILSVTINLSASLRTKRHPLLLHMRPRRSIWNQFKPAFRWLSHCQRRSGLLPHVLTVWHGLQVSGDMSGPMAFHNLCAMPNHSISWTVARNYPFLQSFISFQGSLYYNFSIRIKIDSKPSLFPSTYLPLSDLKMSYEQWVHQQVAR